MNSYFQSAPFWGVLILLFCPSLWSQNSCDLSLSGYVIDEHDGQPLAFAEVVFENQKRGAVVDSNGFYSFENLCAAEYTITAFHVGCEPVVKVIFLNENTSDFNFYPEHHREFLSEIMVVEESSNQDGRLLSTGLSVVEIQSLKAPELQILQSGSNIKKPMIRGFYGNRVNTVSGGVTLQDQQWGQDHAPSFSLYPAQQVRLTLGASALSFGPGAIGGVFRLVPENFFNETTQLFFSGFINGKGGNLGFIHRNKISENWAYGLKGVAQRNGDLQAPDYNLSNTAAFAGNAQLDLAFDKNDWLAHFTFSYDRKNLGILRASHIGNLTDFEAALQQDEPLFTDAFSYQIENPRQFAQHYLAKTALKKNFKKDEVELSYSYQNNLREEYDIRRGGRSEIPSIDLRLQAHHFALKHLHLFNEKWQLESGTEQEFQINTNLPGTGFLPVLPNFNQSRSGAFSILQFNSFSTEKIGQADLGIRYDITETIAQFYDGNNELNRESFSFQTFSSLGSVSYFFSPNFSTNSELGFVTRAPAPNELLARGLHHGTATIEEGNLDLQPERSFSWNQRFRWNYAQKWNLDISLYANPIQDFIYQNPLPEPRLTVRGAFPVLQQEQTDAFFAGLEMQGKVFLKKFTYAFQGNYIYAKDVGNDGFLPLVPPLNAHHDLRFQTDFSKEWKTAFAEIGQSFTAEQTRFDPAQDLAPPPESYFLHDAAIGITRHFEKSQIQIGLRTENLFNKKYRNYLDRFRYFSDATGFNLILECLIKF